MQPKNEGCIKNLYSDTPSSDVWLIVVENKLHKDTIEANTSNSVNRLSITALAFLRSPTIKATIPNNARYNFVFPLGKKVNVVGK